MWLWPASLWFVVSPLCDKPGLEPCLPTSALGPGKTEGVYEFKKDTHGYGWGEVLVVYIKALPPKQRDLGSELKYSHKRSDEELPAS